MFITLLRYCCTCNALRAATQVCHTTCSSSSFLTAAIVSFTPLRSLLPSFRFITPRSQLIHLLQGWASHSQPQSNTHGNAPAFRKPNYNTHWVPFRCTTSFIHFSSVQSTRCQIILLAGYPHFGCVQPASVRLIPSVHFAYGCSASLA